MGLRDIGAALPPGFRFYPSDEELVCHYLYKKIANEQVVKGTLVDIDLHTCEPWQLPEVAKLNSTEWYFFSFRDRKYATGYRSNRATACGYWKATGKDRTVVDGRSREIVGMRKTLVFYKNRAPNGIKTGWIMHEFRLENPHIPPKEDWVLCRVFHKAKSLENNDKLSLQNDFETTCLPHSQNLTDHQSHDDHKILSTCGYTHQNQNPNNFLDLPALNPTFLHQSRENTNKPPDDEMKNADDVDDNHDHNHYGFLFDNIMGFEESKLEDVAPSNIEELRFDNDDDDDQSLVCSSKLYFK